MCMYDLAKSWGCKKLCYLQFYKVDNMEKLSMAKGGLMIGGSIEGDNYV